MRPLPTVMGESAPVGIRLAVLSTQEYVDAILSGLREAEAAARAQANPLR